MTEEQNELEPLMMHRTLPGIATIEFTIVPGSPQFRCVLHAYGHYGGSIAIEQLASSTLEYIAWVETNVGRIAMAITVAVRAGSVTVVTLGIKEMLDELRKGSPAAQRALLVKSDVKPTPMPAPSNALSVVSGTATVFQQGVGYSEVDTTARG